MVAQWVVYKSRYICMYLITADLDFITLCNHSGILVMSSPRQYDSHLSPYGTLLSDGGEFWGGLGGGWPTFTCVLPVLRGTWGWDQMGLNHMPQYLVPRSIGVGMYGSIKDSSSKQSINHPFPFLIPR